MHLPSYTFNKDPYLINRHFKNVNSGQMFSQHKDSNKIHSSYKRIQLPTIGYIWFTLYYIALS